MLENYWFAPTYQPDQSDVAFELKPLSQKALHTLRASLNEQMAPSWDAIVEVFRSNVVSWRGLPVECSNQEKGKILSAQVGDFKWSTWLVEIAGNLYAHAVLSETERKNSSSPSTSPSTPSG